MKKNVQYSAKLKLETGTHTARINHLRVTPDGRTLVTSGVDKTIRLWDVETKKQTGMLLGQIGDGGQGKIHTIALSRDGRHLATLSWVYPTYEQDPTQRETDLRVYELSTGNLQAGFRHPGTLQDLDFSPDGRYLALSGHHNATQRGTAMFFESKTLMSGFGKLPAPLASEFLYEANREPMPTYVRFVPEKRAKDGSYRVITSAWEHWRPGAPEYSGRLFSFSFSAAKGLVKSFERELEDQTAPNAMAVSSQFVVIVPEDLDAEINKKFYCYGFDGQLVNSVDSETPPSSPAFSPDGNQIILGQRSDGTLVQVKVYDVALGRFALRSTYFGHDSEVLGTALLSDGTAVSAGGDQNAIHFWSTKHMEGELLAESKGLGRVIHVVGISMDEKIGFGTRDNLRLKDGRMVLQRAFDLKTMALKSFPFGESTEFQRAQKTFGGQTVEFSEDSNWNLRVMPEMNYLTLPSGEWYNVSTFGFTEKGTVVAGSQDGKVRAAPLRPEGYHQMSGRVLVGHEASVLDHASAGRWLVTAGADQVMRLWFLKDVENDTGEHLYPALNLFVGSDDEWVIWSRSGYYNSSQDGDMRFGYHLNRGLEMEAVFIPSDRLSKTFYRPDIIQAIIEHGSEERAFEAMAAQGIQIERPDLINTLPPIVELLKGGVKQTATEVTFRFAVQNLSPKNPVRRVWVVQNERFVWEADKIATNFKVTVRLQPGKNIFKILAENGTAKSIPICFEIKGTDPKPVRKPALGGLGIPITGGGSTRGAPPTAEEAARSQANTLMNVQENGTLFLLAVGVSKLKNETDDFKSLTYADDDAISIYNAFGHSKFTAALEKKGAFKNAAFESVEATVLLNEDATKAAIFAALEKICQKIKKRSTSKKPKRDVLMVFLSGHGVRRSDTFERELYFWCYDLLKTSTRATGLSFIELGEKITALPVEVILATDACHSGMAGSDAVRGVDPNELAKRIYAINERGIYILNAARSEEFAREHPAIGHGVFTKAILESLEFEADFSMLSIMASVQRRVLHYTNGIQTPVFRMYGDLLPLVIYEK